MRSNTILTSIKKLLHRLDLLPSLLLYFVGYFFAKFKSNNKIWLISERFSEARDNGYWMFRYIRENHPQIKVFYIINKSSPDYDKVYAYGRLIKAKSFLHYIVYFRAKLHISTHNNGTAPYAPLFIRLNKITRYKPVKVFLQHGIIKDFLPSVTHAEADFSLFVCGAKPEYEYVLSNFGYTDKKVRYLGLARFDTLNDTSDKKQILLMPTFRSWLSNMNIEFKPTTKDRESFRKSEYFQKYNNLLNNKHLAEVLHDAGIKLVFYPHFETQIYLDMFTVCSDNIFIADKDHYDVQELLKSSAMLVTDYSSVFFDFAYMNKPVLYYQFDADEFRKAHYAVGYFSYENDGFGEVCINEEELVSSITCLILNNFCLEGKYFHRIKRFFPVQDKRNRQRNFEAILSLDKELL